MKKIFFMLVLMPAVAYLASCSWDLEEDELDYVYIRNISVDTIHVAYTCTFDSTERTNMALYDKATVLPYSHFAARFAKTSRRDMFYEISIWKKSTIDKYSNEYLYEHHIVDKHVFISYNELERQNFTITFE